MLHNILDQFWALNFGRYSLYLYIYNRFSWVLNTISVFFVSFEDGMSKFLRERTKRALRLHLALLAIRVTSTKLVALKQLTGWLVMRERLLMELLTARSFLFRTCVIFSDQSGYNASWPQAFSWEVDQDWTLEPEVGILWKSFVRFASFSVTGIFNS